MTTKDLFRCIGNLSDGMLEEAADIKRKPRWRPIAALAACALLCAAAYIVRVQNERALKQVCDFDSVHFAGRIWFDFKSGIRA